MYLTALVDILITEGFSDCTSRKKNCERIHRNWK